MEIKSPEWISWEDTCLDIWHLCFEKLVNWHTIMCNLTKKKFAFIVILHWRNAAVVLKYTHFSSSKFDKFIFESPNNELHNFVWKIISTQILWAVYKYTMTLSLSLLSSTNSSAAQHNLLIKDNYSPILINKKLF